MIAYNLMRRVMSESARAAGVQQHHVGDRPDRYEPRVVKRRPKPFKLMQKPRRDYKPREA